MQGTARVTRGDETFDVARERVDVHAGRARGTGSRTPATSRWSLIEVQCGDYLGEDDIVRFDDRYGR